MHHAKHQLAASAADQHALLLPHQHTSAYVSIRPHSSAYVSILLQEVGRVHTDAWRGCIRQHKSAYVRIRQHTSAYVSIRAWHRLQEEGRVDKDTASVRHVSIRQHTSAYVLDCKKKTERPFRSMCVKSAYVSIRQHTSAYVSIRQHTTERPLRSMCVRISPNGLQHFS
jgi:isocitrate/isopropylmalate dehydrogenase